MASRFRKNFPILFIFQSLFLLGGCGSPQEELPPLSPQARNGGEELILPFRPGQPHLLTRAYENGSHRRYPDSDERFALDFAMPGCEGFRAEVIAPLSGRVSHGESSGGKGKNVLITRGDGLTCRLAHLDEILVREGEFVVQGELVGREGNSGGVSGSRCPEHPGTHIHLGCYRGGEGVKPEPISGYENLEKRIMERVIAIPLPVPKLPPPSDWLSFLDRPE